MAWISAVFFCLGAADTLLGDRLGLGSAFRQGFAAVVDLLLLMTGFMALAPWLGTHLAPVITPVFSAVGCDPSLFASLFLSCDAGGAVLAAQIAQEPAAGLYNGLIVAAFLGSTINGTIPLALGQLTGTKRAAAVRGLFLGFLVLPVGCLLTGALCGIPLSVLLHNTWPVLAVAALLLLLFKSGSSAIGPIFNGISLAVRGLTLFGFCTQKEVLKWNESTQSFEKHHSLNFFYTDDVTVEYALWNEQSNAYTDIKQKAVYRQTDSSVLRYLSYEWDEKNNDWSLTADHHMTDESVQLLAEK